MLEDKIKEIEDLKKKHRESVKKSSPSNGNIEKILLDN